MIGVSRNKLDPWHSHSLHSFTCGLGDPQILACAGNKHRLAVKVARWPVLMAREENTAILDE